MVFFGWRPHPMNVNLPFAYLTDGQGRVRPQGWRATVLTLTRPGYSKECPNVGKLLKNLVFDVAMEDRQMSDILDKGMQPDAAVRRG